MLLRVILCYKANYLGNYCWMLVNYNGKSLSHLPMGANLNTVVSYCGILTLEKVGIAVNYIL